eukprot:TRINITY_DN1843_c0_g1_i2.p1 TRINITY_DN1843_c0_g1~~TRINITY_DN1843_c0_g1_i2.p1  ORF type:complete len:384 (-),score=100.33 TRINITY_DN1843_c0_g1_i2:31-1182(-)
MQTMTTTSMMRPMTRRARMIRSLQIKRLRRMMMTTSMTKAMTRRARMIRSLQIKRPRRMMMTTSMTKAMMTRARTMTMMMTMKMMAKRATNEDEDEDEGDEEDEEKNRFAADDQLQRKAKGVMKETQRGFGVLSNAVEKVKQATENVKSKALKVEQKWQEYGDKMDNAGSALDALSVAALAYENEVQQTFEKNEKKKSPLEEVTKDDPVLKAAEFAPDEQALDKMMKAKVHSYNCKFEPDEKFCCTQDLDWKTIWERSQKGCLKKSGKCGEDMVETSAVSRRDEAKEEVISDDWHCVADGALSIFRDSATWTDIGALENSDFLADLAGIPGSENLLADKLQQESVKKRVIVTIVCNDAEWVNILRTAQALRLCFEKEKLEKGL